MIALDYGATYNSEATYEGIAELLETYGQVITGWTDGQGTLHVIWFGAQPFQIGELARGLRGSTDLFVGLMSYGAFGFQINEDPIHKSYLCEKLGYQGYETSSTADALADLVSGVKAALSRRVS